MTVSLLVGTTKGLFLVTSEDRSEWSVDGPHCNLWPINHAIGDPGTGVIWAGGGSDWEGAGVWRSEDRGASWTLSNLAHGQSEAFFAGNEEVARLFDWKPSPPAPFTGEITALWSLGRVGDRLYAGSKPAMLLASDDGGETWEKVSSLSDHPSAAEWQPGAAGLVLHTIVADPGNPEKFWLGISAAGVFATEDGGATWDRRNRLSNAEACGHHDHPAAPRDGQTGHCVHNMVRADGTGDLLYQQNHHGVYRSRDGGRSWDDITEGLPSTFGFPVHVHPRDGATIWTLPLNGDGIGRYPPDAAAAVWKSTDGGESWEAKRAGLPQAGCYFTVLRQAMAGDAGDPAGIYFGTNSGSVFASTDEGESWGEVARHLPTILCVEALET
ncbi:MAG: sialidase family protein [Boseongicola sp.]|nr:sialidase family protein [Boseongicola sp.]